MTTIDTAKEGRMPAMSPNQVDQAELFANRQVSGFRASEPLKDERLSELARLANLLDSKWRIPGTSLSFGLDAVAGLVPVVGDVGTGVVSAYIIYKGTQLGVPKSLLARMIGNVALDVVVGAVPLLGSVFDLFFKANRRNMLLLRRHLETARDKST